MFEREIKFIYDFNLNKINKLGPYFTFERLKSVDILPAFLHYISAEIDYLIFEDRQKLLKDSVFDYSGEKISYYFEEINQEIKKTKRFSSEYIGKLILHASSFTVNYLVRPKWTLNKFVFDEGGHKTTAEIKQILNYVYYYNYLTKIIISYINTKKIISMDSEEFVELVNRVDRLGIESYLNSILEAMLKSMSEFFNTGEIQKNKIPLVAVKSFLSEKQLGNYIEAIDNFLPGDENTKYDIGDYRRVFNKVLVEKEEKFEKPEKEIIEEKVEDSVGRQEEIIPSEKLETPEIKHEEIKEETKSEGKEKIESKPKKIKIKMSDEIKIEQIDEEEESASEVPAEEGEEDENTESMEEIIRASKAEYDEDETPVEESETEENDEYEELNLIEKEAKEDSHEQEQTVEEVNEEEVGDETMPHEEQITEVQTNLTEENSETDELNENEVKKKHAEELQNKEKEEPSYDVKEGIDIAEILEHKDMTKVIKVIFDYDIEEFANTIDRISQSRTIEEANAILEQTLEENHIDSNSKEAEIFRSIISEYFHHK